MDQVINDTENESFSENEESKQKKSMWMQLLYDFGVPVVNKENEEDLDDQFKKYENKNLKYYKILLN